VVYLHKKYLLFLKWNIRVFLLLLVFVCMSFTPPGGEAEARHKALFIYSFIKYINWPNADSYDTFTIGILGKTDITAELKKICETKAIEGKTINVIALSEPEMVNECQVVFITRPQSFLLDVVLDVIEKRGTLVITEAKGMLKSGSAINLIKDGSKEGFEVSTAVLKKQGLVLPQNLLVLAVNVEVGPKF